METFLFHHVFVTSSVNMINNFVTWKCVDLTINWANTQIGDEIITINYLDSCIVESSSKIFIDKTTRKTYKHAIIHVDCQAHRICTPCKLNLSSLNKWNKLLH